MRREEQHRTRDNLGRDGLHLWGFTAVCAQIYLTIMLDSNRTQGSVKDEPLGHRADSFPKTATAIVPHALLNHY